MAAGRPDHDLVQSNASCHLAEIEPRRLLVGIDRVSEEDAAGEAEAVDYSGRGSLAEVLLAVKLGGRTWQVRPMIKYVLLSENLF